MREKDKINFLEACVLCGSDNAIGVTAIETGPAGVNEKGLSGGSNKKCGLTALDVDEIDLQRLLIRRWNRRGQRLEEKTKNRRENPAPNQNTGHDFDSLNKVPTHLASPA
jgi:hypothetical protein